MKMKTKYYIVTCWKGGKLVYQIKITDEGGPNLRYRASKYYTELIDTGQYDKVVLTKIKQEVWETWEQHLNTGAW